MAWYWIVLIVIGYLLIGGASLSIICDNKEDAQVLSLVGLLWPILIVVGLGYLIILCLSSEAMWVNKQMKNIAPKIKEFFRK